MKFIWKSWDIDGDGEAYVVAKRVCPQREDVPEYIIKEDNLHPDCREGMVIEEAWCKYQCRSDWENTDGPHGFYAVEFFESFTKNMYGKRKPGWFPVWIVRKGDWY